MATILPQRKSPRAAPIFTIAIYSIIFFTFLYVFQTQKIFGAHFPSLLKTTSHEQIYAATGNPESHDGDRDHRGNGGGGGGRTELRHIVFGIASSSKVWEHRKNYIRLWWEGEKMRGFAWLDKEVGGNKNSSVGGGGNNSTSGGGVDLPAVKVSSDTSGFKYTHKFGDPSGLRLTRIVAETVRLGLKDVRWIVMGDDDTFFIPDNLVRVLRKYDHNGYYYIGSTSETHIQNIDFSYAMAYGGGGFAISYPLAVALEKMQDSCIQRYPSLYGSDDRIQACMAELGVALIKETGFHQMDIYGSAIGLLAAHPIRPLLSLHHLDLIEPIFPNMGRVESLQHLRRPIKLDSAGLMQQSICYDKARDWTVSVSWGYVAQIYRGFVPAREMEKPIRTFVDWYRKNDGKGLIFNTRGIDKSVCGRPAVYVLSNATHDPSMDRTVSKYDRVWVSRNRKCRGRRVADPADIRRVKVFKKVDPDMWDKPPRRHCCRVLPMEKKGTISIDVGECRENEIIGY